MSRHSSTPSPAPISQNTCFDPLEPLELDSFINYDQVVYPTPSLSPSSSRSQSKSQQSSSLFDTSSPLPTSSQSSSQQIYSGPSHQYDEYKQQTGLPVGALANTFAINEASNVRFIPNQSDFSLSNDNFFGTNPNTGFDFGSTSPEMSMDFETAPQDGLPAFFYPADQSLSNAAFVNPAAVSGQEESMSHSDSVPETPAPSNVGRLWPGMHQQQALAKAQAEASQKKQNQQEARIHKHSSRSQKSAVPRPNDPIADEKISQLLNSMRHSSVTSSNDDGITTPNANGGLSHITRTRKDEEDMDEDERLLASEEGKKLSSKERRQLRNKVSARAFRSRRKGKLYCRRYRFIAYTFVEYIGQLEGELATKANEMSILKEQNRALMDENAKLTNLTRMLLSSSAFSTFVDEMGASSLAAKPAPVPEQADNIRTESSQPIAPKDVNPYQASQKLHSQQSNAQVGMAIMPNNQIDFSTLDINNSPWDTRILPWQTTQPQVFSVLDLPAGPAVDTAVLSGKGSNSVGSCFPSEEYKEGCPTLNAMPSNQKEVEENLSSPKQITNIDFDESDPAFALYADSPSPSVSAATKPCNQLLEKLDTEKISFGMVILSTVESSTDETSPSLMERLEQMCRSMDVASDRIGNLTSHL